MLNGIIWLDDEKKLKRVEVTMSAIMDWNIARNFQDFWVDKVTEFNQVTTEQDTKRAAH